MRKKITRARRSTTANSSRKAAKLFPTFMRHGADADDADVAARNSYSVVWPDGRATPVDLEISQGHQRGAPLKIRGLVVEFQDHSQSSASGRTYVVWDVKVHGVRNLHRARANGHDYDGIVSLNGKSRKAHTSTVDFIVRGKRVTRGVIRLYSK